MTGHIQESFRPAILEGLHRCIDWFGNSLKSFYLSGSVASGEAWLGASDADCFLFLNEEPDKDNLAWCKCTGKELEKKYPGIRGYHLGVFSVSRLQKESSWQIPI